MNVPQNQVSRRWSFSGFAHATGTPMSRSKAISAPRYRSGHVVGLRHKLTNRYHIFHDARPMSARYGSNLLAKLST